MSRNERLGFRDEAYSRWHRSIPLELNFIDLDWMEVCATCKRIVGLYELARDTGQERKDAWATGQLARRAQLPGFVVLYTVVGNEVTSFRVRELYPNETGFTALTPEQWTKKLRLLRCHEVQATPEAEQPAAVALALPKESWRLLPQRCHTCGKEPIGTFPDGSPLYRCYHSLTA